MITIEPNLMVEGISDKNKQIKRITMRIVFFTQPQITSLIS